MQIKGTMWCHHMSLKWPKSRTQNWSHQLCGGKGVREISVPFPQVCCIPKTILWKKLGLEKQLI